MYVRLNTKKLHLTEETNRMEINQEEKEDGEMRERHREMESRSDRAE